MKKVITLVLLCATLAIPIRSDGWVAAGGGGRGWVAAGGGGCWHGGWGCGGVSTGTAVAAGVAGLAVGAAIGASTRPAVVVAPAPVVVAPIVTAPVVVAPIVTSPAFQVPPAIGAIYYSLPNGTQSTVIHGQQYYVYGSFCYKPYFGGNGVYYEVVPYPI